MIFPQTNEPINEYFPNDPLGKAAMENIVKYSRTPKNLVERIAQLLNRLWNAVKSLFGCSTDWQIAEKSLFNFHFTRRNDPASVKEEICNLLAIGSMRIILACDEGNYLPARYIDINVAYTIQQILNPKPN